MPEKTLHVEVRVRNNRILSRRKKYGLTQRQMAELIGIRHLTYADLECLRTSPLGRHGEVRTAAKAVMEFLGCEFDELWPDLILKVKNRVVFREMDAEELCAFLPALTEGLPPDEALDRKRLLQWTAEGLEQLSASQKKVIEGIVGGGRLDVK